MSASVHLYAFKPPDETWHQMKAIYDGCKAMGIEVPLEVEQYFDGEPDPAGVVVELPLTEYVGEYSHGWEVKVAEIPPATSVIRAVMG